MYYDEVNSLWKPITLASGVSALSSLSDVVLGSLVNDNLLTYDQTSNKWINKVKPTYSINEMTDFDNTVAKLDNDFMSYNLTKSKWEPRTFEQEAPNYLTL